MAEEVVAGIAYVVEAFAGAGEAAAAGEGIGAAGTAAEAAAAASYGTEAYGASASLAAYGSGATAATSASTYATYASMAAQALGGVAAVNSSLNQQNAAEYNSKMGVSNAQQAAMQAGAAEAIQRQRAGLILGEQRAAFAGSGVDPSSGTGLLSQQQSATNAELDALNVRYQGLVQGRGLLAQSQLDARQGQIYGQNAAIGALNTPLGVFGAYQQGQGTYLRQKNFGGSGYGGGY